VWRIDGKRMLQMEVSWGGQKFVSNGRLLKGGREMPWLTRCDAPVPATVALNGVKAIFEKYKLLGTFAADCSKPASPNNYHFINRLVGNDIVQRDRMSGPTTRDWVAFLDNASELKPNEIAVSGMHDAKSAEGVWRIEDRRMLVVEASLGGEKQVSNGRLLQNGAQMPWFYRCDGG